MTHSLGEPTGDWEPAGDRVGVMLVEAVVEAHREGRPRMYVRMCDRAGSGRLLPAYWLTTLMILRIVDTTSALRAVMERAGSAEGG